MSIILSNARALTSPWELGKKLFEMHSLTRQFLFSSQVWTLGKRNLNAISPGHISSQNTWLVNLFDEWFGYEAKDGEYWWKVGGGLAQ